MISERKAELKSDGCQANMSRASWDALLVMIVLATRITLAAECGIKRTNEGLRSLVDG